MLCDHKMILCFITFSFVLAYGYNKILDPSRDQELDGKLLPKGKQLPMVIIHDKAKAPLENVIKSIIANFVQDDSVTLVTRRKKLEELKAFVNSKVQILDYESLNGIEDQWIIITDATDLALSLETLSRARNGLVMILDIPFQEQVW